MANYAMRNMPGTNLPWSVRPEEPTPTWNGQAPAGVPGGSVPLYTGPHGGGSVQWFDPTTGMMRNASGMTNDSRFANARPEDWRALAAMAQGSPNGMLSAEQYNEAVARYGMGGQAYPAPPPINPAETARRLAAARAKHKEQWLARTRGAPSSQMRSGGQGGGVVLPPGSVAPSMQQTAAARAAYAQGGGLQQPNTSPSPPWAQTSAGGLQQANTDPLQQLLRSLFAGSAGLQGLPGMAAGSAWGGGGGQAQGYNLLSLLLQGLMQRGGLPSM